MTNPSFPSQSPRRPLSAWTIAERLERLLRMIADRARAHGLNAAQWTALRYIATADHDARHVSAFAAFHLTSPSSASQTVTALVRKGLVEKHRGEDARQRTLFVTDHGRRLLDQDPLADIVEKIQGLPDGHRDLLGEIMDVLTHPATVDA